MKRRTFLSRAAACTFIPTVRSLAAVAPDEPSPRFDFDEADVRFVAGLRPYRDETYRLELEEGEKPVVHNYGHGGAGITMSWGCAHEVRDLVDIALREAEDKSVAVVGAGVMGLTAATLLARRGYDVSVFAKGFYDQTTSYVAGGQFSPSTVAISDAGPRRDQFDRIIRRSFTTHEAHLGPRYGVSRRRNYAWQPSSSFERIPRGVIPPPLYLDRLPFQHFDMGGYLYQTLLIEPPIFLRQLQLDLVDRGVQLIQREFLYKEELVELPQTLVVNCMGLGSRDVIGDDKLKPIKGQLVLLPPQPHLNYLYQGRGYIFPRQDAVVVGGTFETEGEFEHSDPVPETCRDILAVARRPFDGIFERRKSALPSILRDEP